MASCPTPDKQTLYKHRLRRFRDALAQQSADGFLVLTQENRYYLSGFTGEDGQFDESAGALLITADAAVLLTDSRYELQARQEAPLFTVRRHEAGLYKILPNILEELKINILGIESARISWDQYRGLEEKLTEADCQLTLAPVKDLVETLRICKDPEETAAIQDALHLAESVFENFLETIRPGISEKALAWELEKRLRDAGADGLSFPPIVASGPNSALPHAIPGDRRLCSGEPLMLDFGVKYRGYCSDITRMVFLGRPDEGYRRRYTIVLEAQQLAIAMIAPGVSSRMVDARARDFISRAGYGEHFGHGLGHGVGLAIHEAPRLSPLGETTLTPGMVCTVEPGIYLENKGGIRLENMIQVTDTGVCVLNRTDPSRMITLP